jgi:hypothetical protein
VLARNQRYRYNTAYFLSGGTRRSALSSVFPLSALIIHPCSLSRRILGSVLLLAAGILMCQPPGKLEVGLMLYRLAIEFAARDYHWLRSQLLVI